MDRMSKPIEVISLHHTDGSMYPIRFRVEDEEHQLIRVNIDRILGTREIGYVGSEAYIFVCLAVMNDRESVFEIRYTVRSHSWDLLKKVC